MNMKSYDDLISEPPMIVGWSSVSEVADYISNTNHNIILNGYLLFAYLGKDIIKSVIITTGNKYETYRISVFYEGYGMIHSGVKLNQLNHYINEFSKEKKLKVLYDKCLDRFYNEKRG